MKRSARSTRFPVGLHIMCILALIDKMEDKIYLSSGWMAASVRKNEAMIRQIVVMLSKAGLVKTFPGSRGGTRLRKDADSITLLDIYKAVEHEPLFGVHVGNEECLVSNYVDEYLCGFFGKAESMFEKELQGVLLSDLGQEIQAQALATNFMPPPHRGVDFSLSEKSLYAKSD